MLGTRQDRRVREIYSSTHLIVVYLRQRFAKWLLTRETVTDRRVVRQWLVRLNDRNDREIRETERMKTTEVAERGFDEARKRAERSESD